MDKRINSTDLLIAFDPGAAASADSGVFGLPFTPEQAKVVLIPVPFEVTTSYGGGTADGPQAILEASRQVDLFDPHAGRVYTAGIALLDEDPQMRAWNDEGRALARPIIDAGGQVEGSATLTAALDRVNALCTQLNARVEAEATKWLEQDKIVGVVGGDHATPFGAIAACARAFPGMGILHIDAHADLRHAFEGFQWSHASIMDNVLTHCPQVSRLVQVGIRDFCEEELMRIAEANGRVVTFFQASLRRRLQAGTPWLSMARAIVSQLPAQVYVSFDIDGLDPALCPHTGTPVPDGLAFGEAVALLEAIVESGRRIVGFDLNEVAPGPEGDEWDANVGARLLYKLIGFTLQSQGKLPLSILPDPL